MISACVGSDDPDAWEAFVNGSRRQISLSIIRIVQRFGVLSPDVADDLVQETYIKLFVDRCRLLHQFSLEHPHDVFAYIKTIAMNVAFDYVKSQRSKKRGGAQVRQLPEHLEPRAPNEAIGGEAAIHREVLLREIDDCLGHSNEGINRERDRLIFWLHYQHGMTAKSIAAMPTIGLTVKGVESALGRLTGMVRIDLSNALPTKGRSQGNS